MIVSAVLLWTFLSAFVYGTGVLAMLSFEGVWAWYATLKRAPFEPRPIVFMVVWPVLYGLRPAGSYLALGELAGKRVGIYWAAFAMAIVSLAFNAAWIYAFFGMRRIRLAFIDMLLYSATMIPFTVLAFHLDAVGGGLLVPETAWVLFATVLSGYVAAFNDVEDDAKAARLTQEGDL